MRETRGTYQVCGSQCMEDHRPEAFTDSDVDILERNLKPCPFALHRPWIEETAHHGWVVACDCGMILPGEDPFDAAARWNSRPVVPPRRMPLRESWPGW